MLRPTAAALGALSSQHTTIPSLLSRSYSKRSNPAPNADHDVSATKQWLAAQENKREIIPRNVLSVKYSLSSITKRHGKAYTKATLQVPLDALSKEIPPDMIEGVKNLKSYERSTDILEFSSDQGGMQKENRDICYQKLDGSLRQIATDHVAREAAKDKVTLSRKEQIADLSESDWRQMSPSKRKAHIQRRLKDQRKAKSAACLEEKLRKRQVQIERAQSLDPRRR